MTCRKTISSRVKGFEVSRPIKKHTDITEISGVMRMKTSRWITNFRIKKIAWSRRMDDRRMLRSDCTRNTTMCLHKLNSIKASAHTAIPKWTWILIFYCPTPSSTTNGSLFLFSCRVLKPPGGGSSDLFGGSVPSTPRSTRNNMASNIFATPSDVKNGNGKLNTSPFHRRPPLLSISVTSSISFQV